MALAACGGGGGGKSAANSSPSNSGSGAGNNAPTITGSPAAQVNVGASYSLAPVARDADGDTLAFSIQNRPDWATFSTTSGQLTGKPMAAGAYHDIVISVSDGKSSAALPTFSITVSTTGSSSGYVGKGVMLSWQVPTQAEDGSALTNLSGYRIHYGRSQGALTQAMEVPSAGIINQVIEDLPSGTYYFAVRAITEDGNQSGLSNVVSQVIS